MWPKISDSERIPSRLVIFTDTGRKELRLLPQTNLNDEAKPSTGKRKSMKIRK